MFFKKILPALLVSITAAMSLPAVAQQSSNEHSVHQSEGAKSQSAPQPKRSGKGMNGGMADMDSCPMHYDMMGAKSAEERHAMMERHIKSMTPEMRKKRLAMLEQHMQRMQQEMQMMRDHMNDQPKGATGGSENEHQK